MQLTPPLLVLFLAASTSNQVGQALFGFTLFLITLSLGHTGYVARATYTRSQSWTCATAITTLAGAVIDLADWSCCTGHGAVRSGNECCVQRKKNENSCFAEGNSQ